VLTSRGPIKIRSSNRGKGEAETCNRRRAKISTGSRPLNRRPNQKSSILKKSVLGPLILDFQTMVLAPWERGGDNETPTPYKRVKKNPCTSNTAKRRENQGGKFRASNSRRGVVKKRMLLIVERQRERRQPEEKAELDLYGLAGKDGGVTKKSWGKILEASNL